MYWSTEFSLARIREYYRTMCDLLREMPIQFIERRTFMETLGFVFGMTGFSFALVVLGLVVNLRNEFEALKKNLKDSGVLKDQTKSVNR